MHIFANTVVTMTFDLYDADNTLLESADDPDTVHRFGEKILTESQRLASMVGELIELSRLQGAERLPNLETVDVDTVVSEAISRHKVAADWCMTLGIFAPTFGIIGAVIGLIATMAELDNPAALGAGISGAFCATFLGVYIANGVMLPLSNRMKRLSTQEASSREMVMEGVLAIQGGQNPRVIEETLLSYLPPKEAAAIRESSNGG